MYSNAITASLNNSLSLRLISFYTYLHLINEHYNSSVMKNITTNQEILLLPGTSFFKRDWCEKDNSTHSKRLSQKEQLIQLCWNGMLQEMLPEINETTPAQKPLTIWEINETSNLLDLRLGEFNELMNDDWSINPYVFMAMAEMN